MGNPRLKFNHKEFGLRQTDDDTYELRNAEIFQKYFDSEYVPQKHGHFFHENPISQIEPEQYHKIESFCFVTTENIQREAAMLLKSLRKFHDQPVYIICDKLSKRFLTNQGLVDDNVIFKISAEKDELVGINKDIFHSHKCIANNVHNPAAILKKMDVMDFALKHHNNTFFLDSDIIVLDDLQEYFQAKVVLSPHHYPKQSILNGYENGFYNAGYIFCASKGFPKMWKQMYLTDSTFFEQECMNRIPDVCKVQTFSKEHNVGFWRGGIIPKHIKTLHFHITNGVDKNRDANLRRLNSNIRDTGVEYMKTNHIDLYNYYLQMTCPKKVAFVHFAKTGGVYVNKYLKTTCLKPYLKYFSWHLNLNPYKVSGRDWTIDEMHKISVEAGDYSFLTQHHINWDIDTVKKFKENGWFTFMFLRKPEELLCSLFNWSSEQNVELRPGLPNPTSIEEAFELAVKCKGFERLWRIPDYIDQLDYVAEFNDANFSKFLLKYFGEIYEPRPKSNTSLNKGFNYYYQNGDISEESVNKLINHPEYKKVLTRLS
tara:strand:+ start:181 stop:1803 length:1623 start_codon:yes stop_codon:yes gene_type:complete